MALSRLIPRAARSMAYFSETAGPGYGDSGFRLRRLDEKCQGMGVGVNAAKTFVFALWDCGCAGTAIQVGNCENGMRGRRVALQMPDLQGI